MKTIVLDTNILIDNVHGFASWVNDLLKKPKDFSLVIPSIVIAEYLTAKEFEDNIEKKKADSFLLLFKSKDFNNDIAEILGKILRRKSYPQGADLGDLIIASTAIYLDAELATNNKAHFKNIPDLRFFNSEKLEI